MTREYHSGCTHPEFEEWWEQFGEALTRDQRLRIWDIALAAWAASQQRTREFMRMVATTSTPDSHAYDDEYGIAFGRLAHESVADHIASIKRLIDKSQ